MSIPPSNARTPETSDFEPKTIALWLKLKVWIRITKGTITSNTIWEPYTEQNHNDIVTTFT